MVNLVSTAGGALSAIGILFMAVATSYEVMMRYIFRAPTKWVLETQELMMVFVVCVAAAYTLKNKGHVRVDILTTRLGIRGQKRLDIMGSIMGILYCGLLGWAGFTMALNYYHRWAVSMIIGVPLYLVMVWVGIGGTLFALQYILKLISALRNEG